MSIPWPLHQATAPTSLAPCESCVNQWLRARWIRWSLWRSTAVDNRPTIFFPVHVVALRSVGSSSSVYSTEIVKASAPVGIAFAVPDQTDEMNTTTVSATTHCLTWSPRGYASSHNLSRSAALLSSYWGLWIMARLGNHFFSSRNKMMSDST